MTFILFLYAPEDHFNLISSRASLQRGTLVFIYSRARVTAHLYRPGWSARPGGASPRPAGPAAPAPWPAARPRPRRGRHHRGRQRGHRRGHRRGRGRARVWGPAPRTRRGSSLAAAALAHDHSHPRPCYDQDKSEMSIVLYRS